MKKLCPQYRTEGADNLGISIPALLASNLQNEASGDQAMQINPSELA